MAVGTKCNKLLRVDTETMAVLEVQTAVASSEPCHMPTHSRRCRLPAQSA